jgi:hypothetical protein
MSGRLATRMRSFSTIRSNDNNPLTVDQMMRVAPSIFAVVPHHTRSERYAYIPTSQVLAALQHEGFQPFSVSQSRTRIADRHDYTRHLIRLRHVNDISNPEAAHEIAVLNSHDGTSSYQILGGMFRYVCANGLVCGDIEKDIRIRHKGNIMDDVVEGVYSVMERQKDVTALVDSMRSLTLGVEERMILAEGALALRFGEDASPITTAQVLQARRNEDAGNSLWQVFNRVQENVIQGGMDGRGKTGKIRKVREITGMDQDTKLNRALWTLTAKMAELKAA